MCIIYHQKTGLYKINYITSYNYDFVLDKYITLDDIFEDKTYSSNILVDENQAFYIKDNSIVICYSSYENNVCDEIYEHKIYFKDLESHLTNYTTERLL